LAVHTTPACAALQEQRELMRGGSKKVIETRLEVKKYHA